MARADRSRVRRFSQLLGSNRTAVGLLLGLIGALLFMLAYLFTSMAYSSYYGASACVQQTFYQKLGSLLTAPLNYCEDLLKVYGSAKLGVYNNAFFPAFFIGMAIMYSWSFEKGFKRLMSFRGAIIVAITSTYALSLLNWWNGSMPIVGTSIIGFDMLLFLLFGVTVDYAAWIHDKKRSVDRLKGSWWARSAVTANRRVGGRTTVGRGALIAYGNIKAMYVGGALFLALAIIFGYILNPSAINHMAGGFIFLLYLFAANLKRH